MGDSLARNESPRRHMSMSRADPSAGTRGHHTGTVRAMTIEGYEAVGDPLAEWVPSKKEQRRQRHAEAQRLASHHSWTDDMRLTWEELEADQPCRGGGVPWRGGPVLDRCGMERSARAPTRRHGPAEH